MACVCLAGAIATRPVRAAETGSGAGRVKFSQDEALGQLKVRIDGAEAFVFCYGDDVDLPHYYPLRSPSGKLLTVQKTEPYPHHRSVWFADKVELAGGRPVEFYMALTSRNTNLPAAPFTNRIRHVEFLPGSFDPEMPEIRSRLLWEADFGQNPILEELRRVRILPLGKGEYLIDMAFTLTASFGDVTFRSDAVHYAWPFVRMHPQFSVDRGGTLTSSGGQVNEKQTHNQVADWMDYSNTIDGVTEGLSLFSHASNERPHRWLTRDYGTFGPRRVDARSGRPFTLRKGESLRQRVGLLGHRGDVVSGGVAQRYQEYLNGLPSATEAEAASGAGQIRR